ncbi:UNVERIFIED_CONTAM: hypothetical protein K2H54_017780 [Gekko kuhli]
MQLTLDLEYRAKEVQHLRVHGEEEAHAQSKAEQVLQVQQLEEDVVTLAHLVLEKKAEVLLIELAFMHKQCSRMSGNMVHSKEEAQAWTEAEQALQVQQLEGDGVILACLALEKKVEVMISELAFMYKMHAEELAELSAALLATPAAAEPDSTRADLTAVLKDE